MKFRAYILTLLCFTASNFAGMDATFTAHADELLPITVQFSGRYNFGKSGYIAALEQGFYKEEGLDVEFRLLYRDNREIKSLLEGDAQFAVSGTRVFLQFLNGKPLVALGAIYQGSGYSLLVRHDSDIATPKDLIGKTVVLTGNHQDNEIKAMIRSTGVDLSEVNFVIHKSTIQANSMPDYLINQTADAIMTYTNHNNYNPFINANLAVRTLKPSDYGHQFYQNIFVTSQNFLQQNPETCQKFYNATIRGWRYAITHPHEMIELFRERYPDLANYSTSIEEQAINAYARVGIEGIGAMNIERWQQIAHSYAILNLAKPNIDVTPFVYNPNPQPNLAWITWVLSITAAIFSLTLGIILWNRQLAKRVNERTHVLQKNQQRQLLMMEELDHRVKNNIAAVMSLSSQTLNASNSLDEFSQAFNGRIKTMAHTHEALTKQHWEGINLRHAATLALHGHFTHSSEHNPITLTGPDVTLPSNAAIPISMTLHELATNAAKYGSLSQPQGKIQLTWTKPQNNQISIIWNEIGGPPITQPLKQGTGITLIKGLIEYELQGNATFQPTQHGLSCQLQITCLMPQINLASV